MKHQTFLSTVSILASLAAIPLVPGCSHDAPFSTGVDRTHEPLSNPWNTYSLPRTYPDYYWLIFAKYPVAGAGNTFWELCGSVAISGRTLLTAAHCVDLPSAGPGQPAGLAATVVAFKYEDLQRALRAGTVTIPQLTTDAVTLARLTAGTAQTMGIRRITNWQTSLYRDDLALVTFDLNPGGVQPFGSNSIPIWCNAPPVGRYVRMLGHETDHVKKTGWRIIRRNGTTIDSISRDPTLTMLEQGDSGSPMQDWRTATDGTRKLFVSGIASNIGEYGSITLPWQNPDIANRYANLYHPANQVSIRAMFNGARTADPGVPIFPCPPGGRDPGEPSAYCPEGCGYEEPDPDEFPPPGPDCANDPSDPCGYQTDGDCEPGWYPWGPEGTLVQDPDCTNPCCASPTDSCGWSHDGYCEENCAFDDSVDCNAIQALTVCDLSGPEIEPFVFGDGCGGAYTRGQDIEN